MEKVSTPAFLTASEVARAIRTSQLSATEIVEVQLGRIEKFNPALNAIVTLDADNARCRAREADRALASGQAWGPLHGVPITLKDSFDTAGLRTASGYRPFARRVPVEDATPVARLREAGAIILGKTNLPTLANGFQTDNALFGRTNNPWDLRGHPAAVRAGRPPLYPPDCHFSNWVVTSAAPFGFRRTFVVCTASKRRRAGSPAKGMSRAPGA